MKKDPRIFIEHILECIEVIRGYISGKTRKDFLSSLQMQDSIMRRIEIIGEAVKNTPRRIKDKHPNVPWKAIAGMRDILIHEYFGVDLDLTWETVKKNLPKLEKDMIRIKTELDKEVTR